MNKIISLLLATLIVIGSVAAQTHKIDSLKQVLESEKEDTNKVNTLNALSREIMNISKFDTSIACANSAQSLAEKLGYKKGIAGAFNNIGVVYWYQGNYSQALEYDFKALALNEGIGNKNGIAINLGNIGLVYIYQSNYPQALEYDFKALALNREIGNKNSIAINLGNIGIVYYQQGNYSQALEYYFKALALTREIGNKNGIAGNLCGIGLVYSYQGNYPQALEYYFKALTIDQEIGNKNSIAINLGNIGIVYYQQGNYSQALEYDLKALAIDREIGNKSGIAINLGNIGNVYDHQGNYPQALEYYFKALAVSREIGVKEGIDDNLGNIGNDYDHQGNYPQALEYYFKALAVSREIGDKNGIANNLCGIGNIYTKQKNFKKAKLCLDSVLILSKNIGEKEVIKSTYSAMSALDSATGNFKKSLEDYKNYTVYKDSLINEATIKKTTQAEMNYEFGRQTDSTKAMQDIADAMAGKEKQRQKVLKFSFVGGFSLMFLASGIFFFQRRRISKEKKRSDELLLNILPAETAEELKVTGEATAKNFDLVTVMFTDFKDFTKLSEQLSATELVAELHYLFLSFDNIIHKYGIEKIKTIGDSYMAAGGLPIPNKTHARDVVNSALEIQQFMLKHNSQREAENRPVLEARIGINTGPVIAGIVGVKKFAYDIWGDTVNLASRMESSGEPGKINISGSTYELVKNDFTCIHRGKIQAKNKGEVDMYFVG